MQTYSPECLEVLGLLKDRKNVLMMGAPACGKTSLMTEVAHAFKNGFVTTGIPPNPTLVADSSIPFPSEVPITAGTTPIAQMPSPDRTNREVFNTVFSANSKPRDFLSGLLPVVGGGGTGLGFKVVHGELVLANKHARQIGGAALLLIDELNRGPAVQLFGDSIVAIEADKRYAENDSGPTDRSYPFKVMNPANGEMEKEYLSAHLYILASMNQADVSVEPLDVAFIRRWERYMLAPSSQKVRDKLGASGPTATLQALPATPGDVLEAAIRAWEVVNQRIALGRGPEFQLGHGVFFSRARAPMTTIAVALANAVSWWTTVTAHLDEVFFGDSFSIAATLATSATSEFYRLESGAFGQEQRQVFRTLKPIDQSNIYELLLLVGRS